MMSDSERAVLGSLLLNNKSIYELDRLKPEHLKHIRDRVVFHVILALHAKNAPFNLVTVADPLPSDGELGISGDAGGPTGAGGRQATGGETGA